MVAMHTTTGSKAYEHRRIFLGEHKMCSSFENADDGRRTDFSPLEQKMFKILKVRRVQKLRRNYGGHW